VSDWRERLRCALPGLWLGGLACLAFVATPAPFASLPTPSEAGKVVGFMFAREAPTSLVLAVLLLLLERAAAAERAERGAGSGFSVNMGLLLGAVACTVVGYYVLQPMMAPARAGLGPLTFGQLHGLSFGLFGVKMLLVLALAWRAGGSRQARAGA